MDIDRSILDAFEHHIRNLAPRILESARLVGQKELDGKTSFWWIANDEQNLICNRCGFKHKADINFSGQKCGRDIGEKKKTEKKKFAMEEDPKIRCSGTLEVCMEFLEVPSKSLQRYSRARAWESSGKDEKDTLGKKAWEMTFIYNEALKRLPKWAKRIGAIQDESAAS